MNYNLRYNPEISDLKELICNNVLKNCFVIFYSDISKSNKIKNIHFIVKMKAIHS